MNELLERVTQQFGVSRIRTPRPSQAFLEVDAARAVDLITHLQSRAGYNHLVFLTAIDVIEQEKFRLLYMLHSYEDHTDLGVEVEVDRGKPTAESIHHLWAQAATYQRELREMFGIDFPGSPRIDESFVLESWDGVPPMRRDFDTKAYSEATYFPRPGRVTHDTVTYMKEKLYGEGEA